MSTYDEIFNLRKNKYGDNQQERLQGLRERDFGLYLSKTPNQIKFTDGGVTYTAALVPFKQDATQTMAHLLTKNTDVFYGGYTFAANGASWLILYKEDMVPKGYIPYVVIKLTTTVSWTDRSGTLRTSLAYLFGPMRAVIKDTIKSGSIGSSAAVWMEALKANHLIMPTTHNLSKGDYLVINSTPYLVTGYDWDSTPGVMYVSLDQTYERNMTASPTPTAPATSDSAPYYWMEMK